MKHLFSTLFIAGLFVSLVQAQNWNLVWSDEFNGTSLNTDNWQYDIGTGSQFGLVGWGNNELQYYTNSTNNVFVEDGLLHIKAMPENIGGMNYSSGRIKSLNKQYWTYGKIEAYIKTPTTQGIWPAFWMLPEAQFWPGEIDIMEQVGNQPNVLHGTVHMGTVDNVFSLGGSTTEPGGGYPDDFHLFAVEWTPDNIKWFVDGNQYFQVDRSDASPNFEWLFAEDYYLLLNVAVGGNWPGSPDASTQFPQEMLVDYVRVYEYEPSWTNSITFRVDMSEQNLALGDIVYLQSSFNNWCGSCNPMINSGNGIWVTTLDVPPGLHEYKFTTNAWDGLEESFPEWYPCTITTYGQNENYVNRYVNTCFEDIVLPVTCFSSCEGCPNNVIQGCTDADANNYDPLATQEDGSCLYAVEFRVNMSNEAMQPGDIAYINGTFNSWCGYCNPMTDAGNGVWEQTLYLPAGDHEFKFTTNGWDGLVESFELGLSCTLETPGNGLIYVNRFFSVPSAPVQLAEFCFNSCESCPPEAVDITFQVDLFNEVPHPSGVYLVGDLQSWTPGTDQMDWVAYGLFEITKSLTPGTEINYRFSNGPALEDEESISGSCASNNARTLIIPDVDTIIPISCFGACESCEGCNDPAYLEFNPYSSNGSDACLTLLNLGCTYPDASNFDPLANVEDGTCLFEASSCTGDLNGDQVINTADLTAMLGVYGSTCP